MLVLTLVAGGAGTLFGLHMITLIKEMDHAKAQAGERPPENPVYAPGLTIYSLPPVVSNLASSASTWIRIELAILYDKDKVQKPEILAAKISEDILGFLKTVTLDDISGPSGLQHLREDLNERASIRSEGKINELLIQSFIIQ
jgi:flagellar FliL protein